jgi:hypothetical protein
MFKISNDLRYCRLGHGKLRGSLSHAAAARDGHQNIEVPKVEMAAELSFSPFHDAPIINNSYAGIER